MGKGEQVTITLPNLEVSLCNYFIVYLKYHYACMYFSANYIVEEFRNAFIIVAELYF